MKKWTEPIVHMLFWLGSAFVVASSFSIQSHEIEVINGVESITITRSSGLIYQLLLSIIFSLIAFYVNVWLIIKRKSKLNSRFPIWYVILTFSILIVSVFIFTEIRLFDDTPMVSKSIIFGIATFYFAISIAYAVVKNSIFDEQRHQQLIIDNKQTELTLLRNQLQPHFLFNALNNLLSMVNHSENPKLVYAFDKLSQLLRFVIEENKSEKIPIFSEIQFLKNYIILQTLRFEDDEVNVQFNVKGKNNKQEIEPGLFIPFVENAFKYGTEPESQSTIDIEFDLTNASSIDFKIGNKMKMANSNGIGTGIETTKKRLELIYPNKHELIISKTNDFIIQLMVITT